MSVYFLWGGIGVLLLFLLIGLLAGLTRGLKRSSLHILFFLGSIVLAFFITKPVTDGILGSTITVDGVDMSINQWIINLIQSNFDLSQFETAVSFLEKLPNAIVSPVMFLFLTLVCYFVFDIIYLIVARVSFGSKKKDFQQAKPYRVYGALIGVVEGFMFLFIMFAPITSLTKTYQEIVQLPPAQTQVLENVENSTNKIQTVGELLSNMLPPQVNEAIFAYNDCVVGKIAGAGGLDNALFDYMSNFDLNGEKIQLRKELINFTNVYDEVTVVYNNYVDNNLKNLNLSNLKKDVEILLNNGMFKTVISDTINDFVVKFDDIKASLNLQNLPTIVEDVINEIQTVFSSTDFDTYQYLKHDIMQIFDVVESTIESNIIQQYNNLEDKSFVGILELVDSNNTAISTIAKNTLSLNLVKDSFNTLGNFASEKISESLKNDQGLEIALNTQIDDKEKMIDDLMVAVDEFLQLNKLVDIPALLNSTDIIDTIIKIEDLDTALTKVGTTFDSLRNLELLTLPVNETRPEKVYVFDNILKLYNLNVLKDEVFLTEDVVEKTKLDTYTKFFNFIKEPIVKAKELGLMELGKEGVTFDTILQNVVAELETNESLLATILMPFYQLTALDLKTMVFDNVVQQLSENVSILDFSEVKNEDTYLSWNNELKLVGKTLKSLNSGAIVEGETTKTYLEYLLLTGADLNVVLTQILNDGNLGNVLDPVFESKIFKNLTSQIFESIDAGIGQVTGVVPVTDTTKLKETKVDVIATIENLLDITLNGDMNNLKLADLGNILDILKTNAYNDGSKDGVFNEIFANIIWFMTGDDITGTGKFAGQTPNTNSSDIKAYLSIADTNNFEGYYTVASYKEIMKELEDVIEFAKTLNDSISGIVLSNETLGIFVENVKTSLESLNTKTEEQQVEILNNMRNLISSTGNEILSVEDKSTYGENLKLAIDNQYQESPEMATAIKNLLGI